MRDPVNRIAASFEPPEQHADDVPERTCYCRPIFERLNKLVDHHTGPHKHHRAKGRLVKQIAERVEELDDHRMALPAERHRKVVEGEVERGHGECSEQDRGNRRPPRYGRLHPRYNRSHPQGD